MAEADTEMTMSIIWPLPACPGRCWCYSLTIPPFNTCSRTAALSDVEGVKVCQSEVGTLGRIATCPSESITGSKVSGHRLDTGLVVWRGLGLTIPIIETSWIHRSTHDHQLPKKAMKFNERKHFRHQQRSMTSYLLHLSQETVFVFGGVEPFIMMAPKDDLPYPNFHWSLYSPQRSMTECFAYFIDVDILSLDTGIDRAFTECLSALKLGIVVHWVHFELSIRRNGGCQGVSTWLGSNW